MSAMFRRRFSSVTPESRPLFDLGDVTALARTQLVETCGAEDQRGQEHVGSGQNVSGRTVDFANVRSAEGVDHDKDVHVGIFRRFATRIGSENDQARQPGPDARAHPRGEVGDCRVSSRRRHHSAIVTCRR